MSRFRRCKAKAHVSLSLQIPHDLISEHEEFMIRFHSDDSMGFKGFALSYVAVDPLDDFDENSENFEEESAEVATPFPGYLPGGPSKFSRKKVEDEDDDDDETDLKKSDNTEDLDEDLITDNEDNYIYNSNRIGKENAVILGSGSKKKVDEIDSY